MNTYEVEFKSTTYRTYTVDAPSKKFAEEKAIEELQMDSEVSRAWSENAEVSAITTHHSVGSHTMWHKLEDE